MKKNEPSKMAPRLELYEDLNQGKLELAETVRRMRRLVGMNQAEYAELIGIAPRVLIDLERGVGNPTLKTLKKIGKPFGLTVVFRQVRK